MRVRHLAIPFVLITCLLALILPARADPQAISILSGRYDQVMEARMARYDVPGIVVVLIQKGDPVWMGTYGLADPENEKPMTAGTTFRVESLSKPVMAWAIMRLAEQGQIDLDAPVTECLSRWRPPEDRPLFSARQLLSQTAGLGLGDFAARYPPGAARPDIAEFLDEDASYADAPGRGFIYSDTGYNMLELLVEDCTGADFAAFVDREIFTPLKMDSASFDWAMQPSAVGHDLQSRPVAPYVYPARGSGGLIASATDMARFAAAGMSGSDQQVLSRASIERMHKPAVKVGGLFGFTAEAYGLGHFTEHLSDGRLSVWHGGQGYGWMSHMQIVPETGDGIVLLSNSQRAWPLFAALLDEWSDFLGVAPVGMTRILWAEWAAQTAITILLGIGAAAIFFAFRPGSLPRLLDVPIGLVASGLIAFPVWASLQDYLFVFSILPSLWPWLAVAMTSAGVSLAVFVLRTRIACRTA